MGYVYDHRFADPRKPFPKERNARSIHPDDQGGTGIACRAPGHQPVTAAFQDQFLNQFYR
jgi:hypothetical protein